MQDGEEVYCVMRTQVNSLDRIRILEVPTANLRWHPVRREMDSTRGGVRVKQCTSVVHVDAALGSIFFALAENQRHWPLTEVMLMCFIVLIMCTNLH